MAAAAGAEKAADAIEPAASASGEDKLTLFYRPRLLARLVEFRSLTECARVLDENNVWLTASYPEEMERDKIVPGVGDPTERAMAFASCYLITDCFRYAAAAEGRTRMVAASGLRSWTEPNSAIVELRIPVDHYRRVVDPEYPDTIHETLMITITCTPGAQHHKNAMLVHNMNKILPVSVWISTQPPPSDDEIHFEINEFLALLEEKLGVPCNTSGRAVKAASD